MHHVENENKHGIVTSVIIRCYNICVELEIKLVSESVKTILGMLSLNPDVD